MAFKQNYILMSELQGTTLKVYLYILRSGKDRVGVREVMRGLGMKSPSHAYYHLDKLVNMGLLEKKYGEYYVKRDVKIDYLREFIFIGRVPIPRLLFLLTFFLGILIYSLIDMRPGELYWFIVLGSSGIGTAALLYEVVASFRRLKP